MEKKELEAELGRMSERIASLEAGTAHVDASAELSSLKEEMDRLKSSLSAPVDSWERTRLARHELRPYTLDYVQRMFDSFSEIHGDRRFADDAAMICGMGSFNGQAVMVVGQQKGRDLKERQHRNFGCANPEGYRKALRAMQLAEKFHRPIFTFVDTQGAYPSVGAEERGQAEAIAFNLREMSALRVPIIVTIIGEGGSGGALGIGVGDRVIMLENSVYSVISPEGCSAILWKDQKHVQEAARALKITAPDLLRFGLIDEVVPEPVGGAHANHEEMAASLKACLSRHLTELKRLPIEKLLEKRYDKFRAMGVVENA